MSGSIQSVSRRLLLAAALATLVVGCNRPAPESQPSVPPDGPTAAKDEQAEQLEKPDFHVDVRKSTPALEKLGIRQICEYHNGPATVFVTQSADYLEGDVPRRTFLRACLLPGPSALQLPHGVAEINRSDSSGAVIRTLDHSFRIALINARSFQATADPTGELSGAAPRTAREIAREDSTVSGTLYLPPVWRLWDEQYVHTIDPPNAGDGTGAMSGNLPAIAHNSMAAFYRDWLNRADEDPLQPFVSSSQSSGSSDDHVFQTESVNCVIDGRPLVIHTTFDLFAEPASLPCETAAFQQAAEQLRTLIRLNPDHTSDIWRLARLLDFRSGLRNRVEQKAMDSDASEANAECTELLRTTIRRFPQNQIFRALHRTRLLQQLLLTPTPVNADESASQQQLLTELLSLSPFEPDEARQLALHLTQTSLTQHLTIINGLLRQSATFTVASAAEMDSSATALEKEFAGTPLQQTPEFRTLIQELRQLVPAEQQQQPPAP